MTASVALQYYIAFRLLNHNKDETILEMTASPISVYIPDNQRARLSCTQWRNHVDH